MNVHPGCPHGVRRLAGCFALATLWGAAGCDNPQQQQGRMPMPPADTVRTSELIPGGGVAGRGRENPFSGDVQAVREGERLFGWYNCAGCHSGGGGGGMGPPLMDAKWIYGGQPAQVYDSIASGRPGGMPAFGQMIPVQEVWQIVAYIETMGGMPTGKKDERRGEGRLDPPPEQEEVEKSPPPKEKN